MNNGTKMTKNDFKAQPTEMNKTELRLNNIKPEIEDADDEPIYAVSDFEGKFDYYIRFFTDIGFFDKKKLINLVKTNIENTTTTEEQKQKYKDMLIEFFTCDPKDWMVLLYKGTWDDYTSLCCYANKYEEQKQKNKDKLQFLKTFFTADVLKDVINKNFKGKIVINGDLYSSKVCYFFDKTENTPGRNVLGEYVKDFNGCCYDLLQMIKADAHLKDKLILIGGNHDIYNMDFADEQAYDVNEEDILKKIKEQTLPYLNKWYKVKSKKGETLIFKHSPYLREEWTKEIFDDKHDFQNFGEKSLRRAISGLERQTMEFYDYNYRGFGASNTFNHDDNINKQMLDTLMKNNAKLVVGHCRAGGKMKDNCICIDDNGEYKYRVFHFEKKKDISNDKNKTESTQYREDIYLDEIGQSKINNLPQPQPSDVNFPINNDLDKNIQIIQDISDDAYIMGKKNGKLNIIFHKDYDADNNQHLKEISVLKPANNNTENPVLTNALQDNLPNLSPQPQPSVVNLTIHNGLDKNIQIINSKNNNTLQCQFISDNAYAKGRINGKRLNIIFHKDYDADNNQHLKEISVSKPANNNTGNPVLTNALQNNLPKNNIATSSQPQPLSQTANKPSFVPQSIITENPYEKNNKNDTINNQYSGQGNQNVYSVINNKQDYTTKENVNDNKTYFESDKKDVTCDMAYRCLSSIGDCFSKICN